MQYRIRGTLVLCALLVGAALGLGACGSSSGDAQSLLKQTFSGSHAINSGNLNFALTLTPSGSSTLTGPITITFGGPFQSRGKNQLPASNFTISLGSGGKSGSLGILSTGTTGYVSLSGTSYQLPAATFQKFASSFAQLTTPAGNGSPSSSLSKLGINPLHWLVNPSVVGAENVNGTDTTHIRSSVNVAALLADLNTFLSKASKLGVSGAAKIPNGISQATRNRIASTVKSPSFDVWTGNGDKTVRKLSIRLLVPVTGQISSLLGGLRTADIGINMQYGNLNQPQTITAPTTVRPFNEFTAKLRTFLGAVQGAVGGGATGGGATGGGASTGGSGSTGSTGGGSSTSVSRYSQCIQAAGSDVRKMQSCASLLNSK
jgi:hypothetical protein